MSKRSLSECLDDDPPVIHPERIRINRRKKVPLEPSENWPDYFHSVWSLLALVFTSTETLSSCSKQVLDWTWYEPKLTRVAGLIDF
jgi:hypothetical protein